MSSRKVRLSLQAQDTAPVRYQDLADALGVQLNQSVAIEALFEGVVRVRQQKLPILMIWVMRAVSLRIRLSGLIRQAS